MDKKKRAFSESCSGKGGFFLMADVIGDNETGKGSLWYAIHPGVLESSSPDEILTLSYTLFIEVKMSL